MSGLTVEPSSTLPETTETTADILRDEEAAKQLSKQESKAHGERIKAAVLASQNRRKAALDKFLSAPRETQRKQVEDKWAELCYELVNKALKYQTTAIDKDFGKLTQLIISAATAKDKVFHREDAVQKQGNVVFNLFGNVGLDAIKRMLQPPAPIVINAKEIHEIPASDPKPTRHRSDPVVS